MRIVLLDIKGGIRNVSQSNAGVPRWQLTLEAEHGAVSPDLAALSMSALKGKGSPYSITERSVPELIPVLGSQPADDVSHKPGSRLPLLSARPAVTPATLKRAATSFAVW